MGRGVREAGPGIDQLCGHCADRKAAISPAGDVWPCVFSRWLTAGNVLRSSLADIVEGEVFERITRELRATFATADAECGPDACTPRCGPSCGPACVPQYRTPCRPRQGCAPDYGSCDPDKRLCTPDRGCKPNKCRPTS
ncbi:SPASM domain-containing protein [Spongiactinospora rosea]|uniref:SPASM domain-containing protein n=1 Tax=Spongiactinospora rosea TaxID=2248750 RepID=UPI0013143001|nr:SPASM domain-containing protein [Spongiactinospora rosea]